jgi:hypothetical protein
MRLKRLNAGVRVCALASFVILAAMAFTAASALALNPERHYEMVSPVYKGGYGVDSSGGILAVAADGERVAFFSFGAFAGTPGGTSEAGYLARRGESGWSTVSLIPPAAMWPFYEANDFSPSLESSLTLMLEGSNVAAAKYDGSEGVFLLHRTDLPDVQANFEVLGGVLKPLNEEHLRIVYFGASADFCHMVFEVNGGGPLLPAAEEEEGGRQLYEQDSGCGGGQPTLRLVGLDNASKLISPRCTVELGIEQIGSVNNQFNAIAADGRELFFTTSVEPNERSGCGEGRHQLFVRLGGNRTLEVSRPLEASQPFGGCVAKGVPGEVPCEGAVTRANADFAGASENGTEAFFTTTAPLVAGDTDNKNDLYMATIGCPAGKEGCEVAEREVTSLVQVSHDPTPGQAAEVQGVVRLAPDGSHMYFVAHGVLSEGANAEGRGPVKGADNLYVYETASGKKLKFIADLCSGPGLSGEAIDVRCPLDLVARERSDTKLLENGGEAQTAGQDGRFLLFSTYAQLVSNDTDTAKDVYRYDAETGMLDRVSLGEAGYHANGNDDAFDATITPHDSGARVADQLEMNSRAISEDGSRVVFATAEPLSPAAVNGLQNIYEWHMQPGSNEGAVSLISSGNAAEPDEGAVISPSGRDVFFTTVQGLIAQDTDGARDIYDARLGGGFSSPPAQPQQCSGDACRGPLTNPAPLLIPGSVSQAPGENLPPPAKVIPKKLTLAQQLARALKACAKKPKSKRAACRRSAHKKYVVNTNAKGKKHAGGKKHG